MEKYDNKKIRIIDIDGDIFEGIGDYYTSEMSDAIYGINEECIKMSNTLFFKPDIKKIEVIDDFTDKYGYLEESIINEDIDLVEDILETNNDISIYRLLLCIEDNLSSFSKEEKDILLKSLKNIIKYNEDNNLLEEANKIIKELI